MQTVLLVDQDSVFRKKVISWLSRCGIAVFTAEDGCIAQDIINQHNVDLTIADIKIPKVDGFALCRWIKQESKQKEMAVILCSEQESTINEYWSLKQGADSFQPKTGTSLSFLSQIGIFLGVRFG